MRNTLVFAAVVALGLAVSVAFLAGQYVGQNGERTTAPTLPEGPGGGPGTAAVPTESVSLNYARITFSVPAGGSRSLQAWTSSEALGDLGTLDRSSPGLFSPRVPAPERHKEWISLDAYLVPEDWDGMLGGERVHEPLGAANGAGLVEKVYDKASPLLFLAVGSSPDDYSFRTVVEINGTGTWDASDETDDRSSPLLTLSWSFGMAKPAGIDEPPYALALRFETQLVGDRPSGVTPRAHPLVLAAVAANRVLGRDAELTAASTDANVPIALGIPAIALGAGGKAGDAHLATEWYENTEGALGIVRALLVTTAIAGVGVD